MKTMPEKILFVDDDPSILSAFMRLLRHETLLRDYPSLTPFVVETAPGGRDALAAMRARGPHAVIVSDLRMPEMDGVQLLEEARTVSPSSVRILLTGQGDIETAIEAVNRGGLFRFLTKPCAPEVLVGALDAALTQYLLVTAERQLLDETLAGSVKVLTEVLSLVNPTAFSRALRIRRIVQHVSERLALADAWQLELASLLSQIGYLTLGIEPEEYDGDTGPRTISQHRQTHPAAARDLLANIPRLGRVAAIVGGQRDAYDPADAHVPLAQRDPVKLGAQVLRAAIEFDAGLCWRPVARGGAVTAADAPRLLRSTGRPQPCRHHHSGDGLRAATPAGRRSAIRDGARPGRPERDRAAVGLAWPRGHAAAAPAAAVARRQRGDRGAAQGAGEGGGVNGGFPLPASASSFQLPAASFLRASALNPRLQDPEPGTGW